VVGGVGADDGAVSEDELGGEDVVDGEAVLAGEEADAARGRQPADADVAVVSGAHRQPMWGEGPRDVAPARCWVEPDPAALRVEDVDLVELGEVDDDAAVRLRPRQGVASTGGECVPDPPPLAGGASLLRRS
jgi:hypothetical protein